MESVSEPVSGESKAAISTIPVLFNFYDTGERIWLGKFDSDKF